MNSPKIKNISWGKVDVEGNDKTFKDVKLYPGGVREWDWNETGTSHSPGIKKEDIDELLEHGSEIIILSRGKLKRLKTTTELKNYLEKNNIEYYILQTDKAVKKYNQLVHEKKVGALIHSTC